MSSRISASAISEAERLGFFATMTNEALSPTPSSLSVRHKRRNIFGAPLARLPELGFSQQAT
jgi:hypothetical protein